MVGGAYAYFIANTGDGVGTDISAQTGTTDSLAFEVGDEINIHADLENFAQGKGSLTDDTTASAILRANNTTNEAKRKYNIFFIIDQNDFIYTTEDNKAELVIRVTDPKDNEVTSIDGLKRVDGGFDVTTRVGSFLIMADYEIETTSTITQDWKLEVELVNLDSDQKANMGKELCGRFYITTEQVATYELAEINTVESTISANFIEAVLNYKNGTVGNAKYYFAIEEKGDSLAYVSTGNMVARLANTTGKLNYIESSEPRYRFGNLKSSTTYIIYSYIVDENGISSNVYTTEITTGEYQLPEVTNMGYSSELNSISVNITAIDGTNEIVNYYYSIGDGEFVSSTEATHTFTDLIDTTTYKIKVKVEDSDGRFSTEYIENVDTLTYINPTITTVATSSTYNSITLTASAQKGTNDVSKYYFSKDNGVTWSEGQTSNVYTFTGLNESTNYTFDIKVSDTLGREAIVYTTTSISTNAYVLPTVTATTSVTSNSITVSATGTNGDGTIIKYMYIRDGQSDWTAIDSTSTTNSYTFTELTPGATYNIRVKVIDFNGRESTEYTISPKTSNGTFSNSTSNTSATYDGNSKTITVNVSPTPTTIYYSTSTQLTTSNYSSSGTTTKPTRIDVGTTTVYWCAVKNGYNTYCNSNTITVNKASPTLTLSSTTASIGNSAITSSVTYTYTGDGTVSCTPNSPSIATYASCSVDTSTKTITFARMAVGTQTFTISASAGPNYLAGTSKTVSVAVASATLTNIVKGLYTADGTNNLYKHDGSGSYTNVDQESGGGEYRFAGSSSSTNNYVCFGSSASTCPEDNLYRIIGVFGDRVKLIKSDYATSDLLGTDDAYGYTGSYSSTYKGSQSTFYGYYWSAGTFKDAKSNWDETYLNIFNLNEYFIINIGNEWANLIDDTTWNVGGISTEKGTSKDARTAYDYEVGANKSSTIYKAKIGLMYLSDYYYAAAPAHWTRSGGSYSNATDDNWMHMGATDWSISRVLDYSLMAYRILSGGSVDRGRTYAESAAVRPVFYLRSTVKCSSGFGTSSSPYRIS
ncbi:MAG: fibronectin type III domain-containing protein [Bacilli bacterium]|nr:fibronectin type III domain-containing protein [Bacilli bacterium]